MIVGLFPGQGSLRPGMGVPWMDHPAGRTIDAIADATGVDVRHLLVDAPLDELVRTDNAQLATFALSAAIADAVTETGLSFDLAIGHSLGEYTALCAAGILSRDEGARLVRHRGLAMAEAAAIEPGTMVAVLGADDDTINAAIVDFPAVVVANRNAPGQTVVSGRADQIASLREQAASLGLRKIIPLEVGGAFHSPLMRPAAEALSAELESASWMVGRIPVVSNVDATSHDGSAPWAALLTTQLTAPVEFAHSITNLSDEATFVECGPGGVLAGLVKRNRKGARTISIAVPEDLAQLEELHG